MFAIVVESHNVIFINLISPAYLSRLNVCWRRAQAADQPHARFGHGSMFMLSRDSWACIESEADRTRQARDAVRRAEHRAGSQHYVELLYPSSLVHAALGDDCHCAALAEAA